MPDAVPTSAEARLGRHKRIGLAQRPLLDYALNLRKLQRPQRLFCNWVVLGKGGGKNDHCFTDTLLIFHSPRFKWIISKRSRELFFSFELCSHKLAFCQQSGSSKRKSRAIYKEMQRALSFQEQTAVRDFRCHISRALLFTALNLCTGSSRAPSITKAYKVKARALAAEAHPFRKREKEGQSVAEQRPRVSPEGELLPHLNFPKLQITCI